MKSTKRAGLGATLVGLGICVMAAGCISADGPVSIERQILGWLSVRDGLLVDGAGSAIRLVGVNSRGMACGTGVRGGGGAGWSEPSPATFDNVAEWGFNSVRLSISWANLEPTPPTKGPNGQVVHHWNGPYLEAIDSIVHDFARRGVSVILDMHQWKWSPALKDVPLASNKGGVAPQGCGMPAWLYPEDSFRTVEQARIDFFEGRRGWDGLADAWRLIAAKYAAEPAVVAADLFNEPVLAGIERETARRSLEDLYGVLGRAVRSVNTRLVLIFQDSSLPEGDFALEQPPPFPNVVYSFHIRSRTWPEAKAEIDRYMERARRWNVPVWIGETGPWIEPDRSPSEDLSQEQEALLRAQFEYLRRQNVGWHFWAYSSKHSGLVYPGTNDPKPRLLEVLRGGI